MMRVWIAAVLCLGPVLPAGLTVMVRGGLPVLPSLASEQEDESETPSGMIRLETALDPGHAKTYLWIDARRHDRYEAASIPGAVWCSEDDWDQGLENLLTVWDGDAPMVVYCDGLDCDASEAVAQRLREELGMIDNNASSVLVLQGGWDAYQQWEQRDKR